MMFGLGVANTELQAPGVCQVGAPDTGYAQLANVMGGFTWGMSSWLGERSPATDAQLDAYSAAIAAGSDAGGDSPTGSYSFSGFADKIGNNLEAIFSPTVWMCNPMWGIGHLIPPLAVVLLAGAILKRGRR